MANRELRLDIKVSGSGEGAIKATLDGLKQLASQTDLLDKETARLLQTNLQAASAAERYAQAQNRTQQTAAAAATAEQRLATTKEQSRAATAKADTSEQNLAKAREQARLATARADKSEVDLEAARERSKQAALRTQQQEEKLAQTRQANFDKYKEQLAGIAIGVAAAGKVFQEAFSFAKEGAGIQFAQERLESLAATMGTTGDSIVGKLQEVTGGLVTNAQLVDSASQIISLGLADNEKDVVRLGNVVSQLGLDMQQVILTFANNSKARLDSLGLSVTDVEERTRAYTTAGVDANKAFDQAVLDALEAKLLLVGSAADSTIGSYQRLEVAYQNLTDKAKVWLAEGLEPTIVGLDRLVTAVGESDNTGFQNFLIGLNEVNKAMGGTSGDGIVKWINGQIDATRNVEAHAAAVETLSEAGGAWAGRAAALGEIYANQIPQASQLTQENERLLAISQEFAPTYQANAEQAAFMAAVERDIANERGDYIVTTEMIEAAEKARAEALAEQTKAEEEAAAAAAAHEEELRRLSAATGDYYEEFARINADDPVGYFNESFAELAQTVSEYRSIAGAMTINQDAVAQGMYESAAAAGASAEQLALLDLATGRITETQAEAIVKSALLKAEQERLGQLYAEGKLSVSEYQGALQSFIAELDNLPEVKTIKFVSDLSGFRLPPEVAEAVATPGADSFAGPKQPAGGGAVSSPASSGSTGPAFPEFRKGGITPGSPDDRYLAYVHGGEMVIPPEETAEVLAASKAPPTRFNFDISSEPFKPLADAINQADELANEKSPASSGVRSDNPLATHSLPTSPGAADDPFSELEQRLNALTSLVRDSSNFIPEDTGQQVAALAQLKDRQVDTKAIEETIKKQQERLGFLSSQVSLVRDLEAAGIDPASVLKGIPLGENASKADLLRATQKALEAQISKANQDLNALTLRYETRNYDDIIGNPQASGRPGDALAAGFFSTAYQQQPSTTTARTSEGITVNINNPIISDALDINRIMQQVRYEVKKLVEEI